MAHNFFGNVFVTLLCFGSLNDFLSLKASEMYNVDTLYIYQCLHKLSSKPLSPNANIFYPKKKIEEKRILLCPPPSFLTTITKDIAWHLYPVSTRFVSKLGVKFRAPSWNTSYLENGSRWLNWLQKLVTKFRI